MKQVSLLAVSVLAANTVLASDLEQKDQKPVEEVLVWGTAVKASSLNLKEDQITLKQADHISDLLRTIPGVDVGGAHSLNQRITIRSMDDKDLRITIDGANQNTYMYHHMGNLQIHADILQSVDVEIGTNSVINGGIGGSVRFETKTARQLLKEGQQFGGRVQATFGDNSGTSYALTGYGQLSDTVDVLAYYNAVERDNYEVGGGDIKDANGVVIPGTNGAVVGLEGDLDDALLKFGWDITANQRVELGYEMYKDEGDYSYRPDMGLATDLAISDSLGVPLVWPTEFTRDTLTLNYALSWAEHSTLSAAVFQNTSNLERDESGWAVNPAFAAWAGVVEGEAENSGINILAETVLGMHHLSYGAEHIQYDTQYKAIYAATTDTSSEEATHAALFIQDRVQLTDAFALIPGIRFDSYNIDSAVVDDYFSDTTFALAGEYAFSDSFLVKLSSTLLFKGPEIGEVFTGAGLEDDPNPSIEAETGRNDELSLAFNDAVFGAESFSAGITYFETEIENFIYDYAGPAKDNIGDMQLDGFEAYIGYDIGSLKTLLTFAKAESELEAFSEYASFDGARLDRQQGDTISLNVDYALEAYGIELHWDMQIIDDVDAELALDSATADNAKDGYTVHNVSARWQPQNIDGVSVTVGVDNLFDEYYASQSSRTGQSLHPRFGSLYLLDYEPGRNIKLTLAYTL